MTARLAAHLVVTLAGATFACGGLDDVDVTRSTSGTVPGVPGGGAAGNLTGFGAISLGGEEALRREGIEPNDIDSARLRTVRLEVESGRSLERWLDEVVIRARATGLPEVTVAERRGIRALPADTRSIELDVSSGVNLHPYLTAETATLLVEATGIPPDADTTVRITATVRVDVNVSGLFD
jgi:hypothetical protein